MKRNYRKITSMVLNDHACNHAENLKKCEFSEFSTRWNNVCNFFHEGKCFSEDVRLQNIIDYLKEIDKRREKC